MNTVTIQFKNAEDQAHFYNEASGQIDKTDEEGFANQIDGAARSILLCALQRAAAITADRTPEEMAGIRQGAGKLIPLFYARNEKGEYITEKRRTFSQYSWTKDKSIAKLFIWGDERNREYLEKSMQCKIIMEPKV